MELKKGTQLQSGKYTIIRTCGQGGFGITYEGLQKMLGRVCIKEFFVKDFCSRDEETSKVFVDIKSKTDLVRDLEAKFYKEAQGLFQLHNNNIVRVIDVFKENDTAYFVMDYIDGKTLEQVIKDHEGGHITEDEALGYFKQIMQALDYIHSKNILHLDIKPENIIIENGRAILIDFGVSKQYDEVGGSNTSMLCGQTPGYSPIEQLSNTVTMFMPATDIYALGATYYKMVTGTKPPSAAELVSSNGKIALPKYLGDVSKNIINRCMALRAEDRPQNISQLLDILTKSRSFKSFFSGFHIGSSDSGEKGKEGPVSNNNKLEEEEEHTQLVTEKPSIFAKEDNHATEPSNTVPETNRNVSNSGTDPNNSIVSNGTTYTKYAIYIVLIGAVIAIVVLGIIFFFSGKGKTAKPKQEKAVDTIVHVVDNTAKIDSLISLADADAELSDDKECLLSAQHHYQQALELSPSGEKKGEIEAKLKKINTLLKK